jgi:peptidoglycan/LPS O-acetylase OafA/YrhL
MDLERETIVQIVVSTLAVATFVVAAVYVSTTYTVNGALTEQGGVALVGAIGLFVLVMMVAGLHLERSDKF